MEINPSETQDTTAEKESVKPLNSLSEQLSELRIRAWEAYRSKPISHWILLSLSSGAMLVAFPASSLLSRLYYANGGTSKWIISWVAVAGWPLILLFLLPFYFFLKTSPTPLTLKLTLSYLVLGFLSAADNLMYAWAYAYLPASTASLVASSSLIFSTLFGYIIVKNKINPSTINAIVIITAAVAIIALDSDSDRFTTITKREYALGFIWDILGSALHGLIFALSELVFVKLLGRRSFHVVLEQQLMVSLFAFVFTTIGVIVANDFEGMKYEAKNFKHGEASYYMVLIWAAVTYQLGVLGATAILYLASTVLAGVLNAVRVPLTSIAAVALLKDPMSGFKILSLIITFWGFGSYIFGYAFSAREAGVLVYVYVFIYAVNGVSSSEHLIVILPPLGPYIPGKIFTTLVGLIDSLSLMPGSCCIAVGLLTGRFFCIGQPLSNFCLWREHKKNENDCNNNFFDFLSG